MQHFRGVSDNASWGGGLSIDGVLGTEVGTESNFVKDGKVYLKPLIKPSLTVGVSYDSEINSISEVQNGTSKPEMGGKLGDTVERLLLTIIMKSQEETNVTKNYIF
jgi:hypothetical protein